MIRSSASRLRCTIVSAGGVEERRGEVAVRRRVDAVRHDAAEAEIARERGDVDRIAVPAIAPEPSGRASASALAAGEAVPVAPERRDVREEEMRDQDRLRRRRWVYEGISASPAACACPARAATTPATARCRAESAAAGTAADRPTPARCASGRCAGGGRLHRAPRPGAARRSVHVLVGSVDERRDRTPRARIAASAVSMRAASSAVSTPARPSARAQARLPVTSSSKRRRSK